MRDDFVGIFQRRDEQAGELGLPEAGDGEDRFAADAGVGGLQAGEDRLGGDARGEAFVVGEGADGPRGDRRIGGGAGEERERFLAAGLAQGEQGGDARFKRGGMVRHDLLQGAQGRLIGAAAQEHALRFEPRTVARRKHQVRQLGRRRLREVGQLGRDVALGVQAEDHAAPVAGGETAVHPAREVEVAAGVDVDVGRTEGIRADLFRLQLGLDHREVPRLLGLREGCALACDRMGGDELPAPVHGERTMVPGVGPAGLGHPGGAAAGAAAVIRQRPHGFVGEILVQARVAVVLEPAEMVEAGVPAVAVVGVVAGEAVEQRADGGFEDVARADAVKFEPGAVGADAYDASAAQFRGAAVGAFGLAEAEIADRRVEPAIDADRQSVRGMVGAAVRVVPADVLHDDALLVRDAVAVLVDERADVRGMQDEDRVAVGDEPAGGVDLRVVVRDVRDAVAAGIAEAYDAAEPAGRARAAVRVAGDEERAFRGGGDEDRRVEAGRRGVGVHVEGAVEADDLQDVLSLVGFRWIGQGGGARFGRGRCRGGSRGLARGRVIGLEVAQRILDAGEVELYHCGIKRHLGAMTERAVEGAAFAPGMDPSQRVIFVRADGGQRFPVEFPGVRSGGTLNHRLLGLGDLGGVGVIDAQQYAEFVAAVGVLECIDLVLIAERTSAERRGERALGVVDLDLDAAVRMGDEFRADDVLAFGPVVPVVARPVVAREALAAGDEFQQRRLHRLGRAHPAGVVEEDRVVLLEVGRREVGVALRQRDREGAGLLAEEFDALVPVRDRGVRVVVGAVEDQDFAGLGRHGGRLVRQGRADLGDLGFGQRRPRAFAFHRVRLLLHDRRGQRNGGLGGGGRGQADEQRAGAEVG